MENWLLNIQSAFGIAVLIGIAWLMSENRAGVQWRRVGIGLALQVGLALILLHAPIVRDALLSLTSVVHALKAATDEGAGFVFGFLGQGPLPFEVTNPNANMVLIAFQILPLVVVVSALAALLWHWGILKGITRGLAYGLERTMGIGGVSGLGAAANLFMGMVEAPLFVRAYLASMTRGELFMLMSVGLATVSGTVLALYANVLDPADGPSLVPGAIRHIVTASLISLPAVIMIVQVMIPETTVTDADQESEDLTYHGSMDAIVRGTQEGLQLLLTISAMLLVIVAFVALADQILGLLPNVNGDALTVKRVFGWVFAPVVWLFGVPWSEATQAGALMGTKTILNEFFAYIEMASLPADALSERTRLIMLYAMCGFANLGSVGMLISTLSTLAPERRAEVVELGMRSLIAGTLATGMTGAVIGLMPF